MGKQKTSFTLRFGDQRLRNLLQFIAERRGVSMNRLIESYVAREAQLDAVALEAELTSVVSKLKSYQDKGWSSADIESEAQAEATFDEPLKARRVTRQEFLQQSLDPHGVRAAFADPVER